MRLEENVERHLRHFCFAIWPSKNPTQGKLLEKIQTRKYRYRILKIGKMSLSIQYSFFIPILGTSLHFPPWCPSNQKKTRFITRTAVLYSDFRPWEKPQQHTWKNIVFFHVCWYSQSAAGTSLAFGATRSGWWMNSKAFTILNTMKFVGTSRIMAANILKYSYWWQTVMFKPS